MTKLALNTLKMLYKQTGKVSSIYGKSLGMLLLLTFILLLMWTSSWMWWWLHFAQHFTWLFSHWALRLWEVSSLQWNQCPDQWKCPFWYCGHCSSVTLRIRGIRHSFSLSGESYCQTVETCKEWLCGRKEWSGCLVKQWRLGVCSYWAPKSCFSLAWLLNGNVGHGSNAISCSHSSMSKSRSLFVLCVRRRQIAFSTWYNFIETLYSAK